MALSLSLLWASHVVETNVLLSWGGGDTEARKTREKTPATGVYGSRPPTDGEMSSLLFFPWSHAKPGNQGALENATWN